MAAGRRLKDRLTYRGGDWSAGGVPLLVARLPPLSLDRSARQALDVITLERQVEDHTGNHGNYSASDQVSVVDGAVGPGLDVEQGDGEGVLALLGQEGERGEELGPGEQDGGGDAGCHQRPHDPPQGGDRPRAVDPGRLLEFCRDLAEGVAHHEDAERQVERRVEEHQAEQAGRQVQEVELEEGRRQDGSRSMLDAPKNPAMPGSRARPAPTVSGSSNGPPWQITRMSSRTLRPASAMARTRRTAWSRLSATAAPMLPAVVRPTWATPRRPLPSRWPDRRRTHRA